MGRGTIPSTNQMTGFESGLHGQNTGNENVAQPNIQPAVSASENTANAGVQYVAAPYWDDEIQNLRNPGTGGAPPTRFYHSDMISSLGAASQRHAASSQLPSSSNYGFTGVSADEHGRDGSHSLDNTRSLCEIRYSERISGTIQHSNSSSGSSSSAGPSNTRHPDADRVAVMDSASFALPQYYREIGDPSFMEGLSSRHLRYRSGATEMNHLMVNEHTHLIPGNYMVLHFQPASTLRPDRQLSSNSAHEGTSATNQTPATPSINGSNSIEGSMGTWSLQGVRRYHHTASSRGTLGFLNRQRPDHLSPQMQELRGQNTNSHLYSFHHLHPSINNWCHDCHDYHYYYPLIPQMQGVRDQNIYSHQNSFRHLHPSTNNWHHDHHHMIPQMRGVRGQNIYSHQQVAAASSRVATNSSGSTLRPARNNLEMVLRHRGSIPPTRPQTYCPHRREIPPETTLRHSSRPPMRVLPADELFALMEEDSDEEDELSEETIARQLRTRTNVSSAPIINPGETASVHQEAESCIICQHEYKDQEQIATLDCGHEYHAHCLKKWVRVRNVCPMCKSTALNTRRNEL
ncbi:hypothetical protein F2P56_020776 [Juglans regia]|uniref:RING-type E3 ubiquitin transferase n=1 Tax=Juglans regia TaxID=51240 RepID=A0A833WQL2_JUGRE|nr:hypothetical protein F2P56_020776 [Juglans regia]